MVPSICAYLVLSYGTKSAQIIGDNAVTEDIRWIQRFRNLDRSYQLLASTLEAEALSKLERAGLIQFFEMTFELAWKMLKDYLTAEGFRPQSPRATIKQAFQSELIIEGAAWLTALEDRNLTVHTYDEETAQRVETVIRQDYFPLLKQLRDDFEARLPHE
jgi:nucleotidyltransferase substrate binding protein (TIGR01987 family)